MVNAGFRVMDRGADVASEWVSWGVRSVCDGVGGSRVGAQVFAGLGGVGGSLWERCASDWMQKSWEVMWPELDPRKKENVGSLFYLCATLGASFLKSGYAYRAMNKSIRSLEWMVSNAEEGQLNLRRAGAKVEAILWSAGLFYGTFPLFFIFLVS